MTALAKTRPSSMFTMDENPRPSRPFSVTLLSIGVLTLAAAGLVRLIQAVVLWEFFVTLDLSPLYIAATGLVICITGVPTGWGLWRGLPWAPRLCKSYLIAVLLYYWLDRLFLAQSQIGHVNTPFALAITVFSIGFTFWVFHRRISQDFFTHWRNE